MILTNLHAFIQLSLNLGSGQVQIFLAVCCRFATVKSSDKGPANITAKQISVGQPFHKFRYELIRYVQNTKPRVTKVAAAFWMKNNTLAEV